MGSCDGCETLDNPALRRTPVTGDTMVHTTGDARLVDPDILAGHPHCDCMDPCQVSFGHCHASPNHDYGMTLCVNILTMKFWTRRIMSMCPPAPHRQVSGIGDGGVTLSRSFGPCQWQPPAHFTPGKQRLRRRDRQDHPGCYLNTDIPCNGYGYPHLDLIGMVYTPVFTI